MNRRNLLKMATAGSVAPFLTKRHLAAQEQAQRATRAMPSPKIKDVQRHHLPACRRAAHRREDNDGSGRTIWLWLRHIHAARRPGSSRRRAVPEAVPDGQAHRSHRRHVAGHVQQFVLAEWSGAEQRDQRGGPGAVGHQGPAGEHARVPVARRQSAARRPIATATRGGDVSASDRIGAKFMAQGFRHVRVQVGVPGMAGYGSGGGGRAACKALHQGPVFEPGVTSARAMKLFEECRKQLGEEVELLHDVHERITPNQAVQFCKDVEKFKLFFLEDPLSPEDIEYFRQIRQQCATPIAMGELFNSPHEWTPLITERLIDYIRMHVSQAGGLTPCRKIAAMGENFGVRTAWHGPGDVSPVGHMANVTLDLVSYNFGVQEYSPFNERTQEVFRGCPVMKDGYLYANETPGWGIEVDEKAAAKYPVRRRRAAATTAS